MLQEAKPTKERENTSVSEDITKDSKMLQEILVAQERERTSISEDLRE
jgi:hypothetical protein